MTISLGIDPSVTATGIVALRDGAGQPELLFEGEIKFPKLDGVRRLRAICTEVMQQIAKITPDRIVLEGYSLNMKNASSVIPLVELGGLLRFCLHLDGLTWFEPKATQVKQFATGKGNSPKDVVMMHVLKRWGHESKTNNTADGYALAAMGLAQAGKLSKMTQEMYSIVMNMTMRQN